MTRIFLAAVLAFFTITTALAQEIPQPEKHEVQARTCYLQAKQYWNAVLSTAPRDLKRLNQSYKNFAECAKVAIETGETLANGSRTIWAPEYFASTIGALYAQRKLAEIDKPGKCSHLQMVGLLAQQAQETASEHGGPGSSSLTLFLGDWDRYVASVKQQALSCGVNLKSE